MQCQDCVGIPPFGIFGGTCHRTYNAYCEGKAGSTPLERLREKRGGQAPRSYPLGAVGFLKPIHPSNWPGQRLVLCHFLGMRYVTGGGCLGYPFSVFFSIQRRMASARSFNMFQSMLHLGLIDKLSHAKADAVVAAKVNWWRTYTQSYVLSRSLGDKKQNTRKQKQPNTKKTKTHTHKKQTPTQTTKQWRDSYQFMGEKDQLRQEVIA